MRARNPSVTATLLQALLELSQLGLEALIDTAVFLFALCEKRREAKGFTIEFPGALYHLTARGNARQDVFLDDVDREGFLSLLGREIQQQHWRCYAYCLMSNHYHLLIETPEGRLVSEMRRLNGAYTQRFNRRHGRVGHLSQVISACAILIALYTDEKSISNA